MRRRVPILADAGDHLAGDRPKRRRTRLQPITLVGPNEREVERRAA
jgi:hypothetical protein